MADQYEGYRQDVERIGCMVEATMTCREPTFLEGNDPFERVGMFLHAARMVGSRDALMSQQVRWLSEMRRNNELTADWTDLSEEQFNVKAQQSAASSARAARQWCATQVYIGAQGFRTYCHEEVAGYTTDLLRIMGVVIAEDGIQETAADERKASALANLADAMSKSWPLWAVTNPGFIAYSEEERFPHQGHVAREESIVQFLYNIAV